VDIQQQHLQPPYQKQLQGHLLIADLVRFKSAGTVDATPAGSARSLPDT
jgi:hypothetical protein